jgi:hypothetical protein
MKTSAPTVSLLGLFALAGAPACADEGGSGFDAPGVYAGTYEVPVPAELADAALYPVDEVEWLVDGDVVQLRYDLPRALVGKAIGLDFQGTFDPDATTLELEGAAGTASCTREGSTLVCVETMTGLLPLTPDYDVVEQLAADAYDGPAADRVEVAKRFAGDPIGIIHIDLDARIR